MRCPQCMGNAFESGRFDTADLYQGEPVFIRNVEAARCRQCGYMLVAAAVAKEIGKALSRGSSIFYEAKMYDLAEQTVDMTAIPQDVRTPTVQPDAPVGTPALVGSFGRVS